MKLMRRPLFQNLCLALLLGLSSTAGFAAERAPAPARPLLAESQGRVIVKFKDDATWRKQILAAQDGDRAATAAQVQQMVQQRAGTLGQRLGLTLQAVSAIEERTQVVSARGIDSARLAARIAADPQVEYAVPDLRRRAQRVPNDPLYGPNPSPARGPASGQWYLKPPSGARLVTGDEALAAIDAQGAWDLSTGNPSLVVAVLDTGIRAEHPDLAGKLVAGIDLVTDATVANDGGGRDDDPADPGDWITQADTGNDLFKDCEVTNSSWHGTQVAGLVAAATDNGTGMAGAGWNVKVQPVRVLGKCFGYDSDIIAGIRWAAGLSVPGVRANATPASVINLSLGGDGACSAAYTDVIREVANRPASIAPHGAVVVAAAGNTTGRAVNNPANCTGAIGVAAVRHIGTKVGFSDLGPQISIAAPGGNCVTVNAGEPCLFPLLTTTNTGTTMPGTSTWSDSFDISVGTSFSAPLVSGTVALMLSANPALTPAQVRQTIMDTARAFPFRGAPADDQLGPIQQCRAPDSTDQLQCYCTTATCGAGMLDARRAVAAVVQGAPRPLITLESGSLAVNQTVVLTAATTSTEAGRTVSAVEWTILDNGGVLGNLASGATSTGPTLTLTPTAVGKFSVRLTVTDSTGVRGVREQTYAVAAAPPVTPTPTPTPQPPADGGGGGGGALSALWLAALALAALLSRPASPRRKP